MKGKSALTRLTASLILLSGTCSPLILTSCDSDDEPAQPIEGQVAQPEALNSVSGLCLLCQGNMGTNKCTLDRFDYKTGIYTTDIFTSANPSQGMGLGDMGNDIHLLGNKIYVTVNGSNLVDVLDAHTSRLLAQIEVPNCRYITDDGKYVYVSSYSGTMGLDPTLQQGFVARIDTTSLTITARADVGYQPEQMAVAEGRLYVANSGGYRYPDYDHTVSVIDLKSFKTTDTIDVAINLFAMQYDAKHRKLYVSSQGDYYTIPSTISVIDVTTNKVVSVLPDLRCKDMVLVDGKLYIYSSDWSYDTNAFDNAFAVYDTEKQQVVTRNLITDGTDSDIVAPYGIGVNPENGDIFVSDARDYVTPGVLRCYTPSGKLRWSTRTGDVPSRMVFF